MAYRRPLDRRRKLDGFFETAVGDFHLMVNKAIAVMCVASTTSNKQRRVVQLDLEFIRTDACQINLYDPAISGAIDVRRRVPKPSRRYNPPIRSDQRELLIDISHNQRISEKALAFQYRSYMTYRTYTDRPCLSEDAIPERRAFGNVLDRVGSSRSWRVSIATSAMETMPTR